jgi:hypothetical protein
MEGLQAFGSCRETHLRKEPLLDSSESHRHVAEALETSEEGPSEAREPREGRRNAVSLQGGPCPRSGEDSHHDRSGRLLREVPSVPSRRAIDHERVSFARAPQLIEYRRCLSEVYLGGPANSTMCLVLVQAGRGDAGSTFVFCFSARLKRQHDRRRLRRRFRVRFEHAAERVSGTRNRKTPALRVGSRRPDSRFKSR